MIGTSCEGLFAMEMKDYSMFSKTCEGKILKVSIFQE